MRMCRHCGVDIEGQWEICPLCQSRLSEETPSEDVFPYVPTVYKKYGMMFRVLGFVSVASAVVLVLINLILEETGPWSLFCLGGILCVWLSLSLAIRKRKNIPKGMLYQVVLISCICVGWDLAMGWRGWSTDFIIPILCLSVLVTLGILSRVFSWNFDNIIIYFWIAALFGVIPIIFYFTGVLNVKLPSIICTAGSLVSIIAILFFKWDSIRSELKRRLSI